MSDDRPSIAGLQRIERDMTPAVWWTSDEDGDVCAGQPGPHAVEVGSVDWSGQDQYGVITLRNAAPVLLEIAATGLVWAEAEDALSAAVGAQCRVLAAARATATFDKHRAALRKVRP